MTEALVELAARCEGAEGPSDEIDAMIEVYLRKATWPDAAVVKMGKALAPAASKTKGKRGWRAYGVFFQRHRYTEEVDAAMMLVPSGAGLTSSRYWIAAKDGPVWSAEIATGGIPSNPRQVFDCYDAANCALAICAAALRSMANADGNRPATCKPIGKQEANPA